MNLKLKNNVALVAYCEAQLGRPYWYGTFGQKATASLEAAKRKQYPKYYKATDYPQQYGQKVHDCIGLIKGFFWTKYHDDMCPSYCSNGFPDLSANGYYNHCTRKSKDMKTMPDIPGIAVFMDGHVGVYVGGGWVIEARGHKYGVVKTRLEERKWTKWAYIEELQYL